MMKSPSTSKLDPVLKPNRCSEFKKREPMGYDGDLGLWRQPASFYAGIFAGLIFQLALIALLFQLLTLN